MESQDREPLVVTCLLDNSVLTTASHFHSKEEKQITKSTCTYFISKMFTNCIFITHCLALTVWHFSQWAAGNSPLEFFVDCSKLSREAHNLKESWGESLCKANDASLKYLASYSCFLSSRASNWVVSEHSIWNDICLHQVSFHKVVA